ncbi:MAG: DegV family protein [Christensenellaceae bacterium]|jgi:DegV family protein with EDD domain|nr:DegV family protein [Christensenellaceae bacterium]
MEKFAIITDTGANLNYEWKNKYNIPVLELAYIINGESFSSANLTDDDTRAIYEQIRKKVAVSTSSVNEAECRAIFEKILSSGQDVLYIGFSSALSVSYATAARVLDELKPTYPERKILYIDSLSAAMGQGRLVIEACKEREAGKTIDEVYTWLQENILKNCHIFTVESLSYLFRGGRLKKSAYLLGTFLQIKPIMFVNNTGHLTPIGKIIGRHASLDNMATRVAKSIVNPEQQTIYITHGNCPDDAKYLADKISAKIKVAGFDYSLLNTIIGAHSGPGTVAVFFGGNKR